MWFCEDCGAKNLLQEGIAGGKTIQVRCQACNYLNTISVPATIAPADRSQAQDAIARIVSPFLLFEGVAGCYLYQAFDHQVVYALALQARAEVLLELGAMTAANFASASACYPDAYEQMIAIANRVVLSRRVAGSLFLILIASPLPDSSEFQMALNLAVSKLLSCNVASRAS